MKKLQHITIILPKYNPTEDLEKINTLSETHFKTIMEIDSIISKIRKDESDRI